MFPVFSIISHSCLPNANPVLLQKNQLALEAKLDIAKGEEITISYISIMQASTYLLFALEKNFKICSKLLERKMAGFSFNINKAHFETFL